MTGLHQDVLKSHSWSANICGEKLWHFWRPGKHPIGLEGKGYITDETVLATADYIIEQKDGQTVFVPSGWFHQVKNIKETLSINHNWINRQSIKGSWEYLNEQLDIIEREFDDLKGGMECEGIGFDFTIFLPLVRFYSKKWKPLTEKASGFKSRKKCCAPKPRLILMISVHFCHLSVIVGCVVLSKSVG